MDILPSTIYLCPECKKNIAKMNIASSWSYGATVYSDGKRDERRGIMSADFTPDFGKCPYCGALFFLNTLESAGSYWEINDYEDIENPNIDDFIKGVEQCIAKTPENEIEVRTCLWLALNDKVRYDRDQDRKDVSAEKKFFKNKNAKLWEENCKALLALLEQKTADNKAAIEKFKESGKKNRKIKEYEHDNIDFSLTIAELHRNLGNFDACFDVMESLPEEYEELKLKYTMRTASHDRLVFIISKPEEKKEEEEEEYDFEAEEAAEIERNKPENRIKYYTEQIENSKSKHSYYHHHRIDAYLEIGDLQSALADLNNLCEPIYLEGGSYYVCSKVYKALGDTDKADWYIFKTKHAAAYDEATEKDSVFRRSKREGIDGDLITVAEYSVQKNGDDFLFCVNSPYSEEEPIEPEILYSGRENALYRRTPTQFILFESIDTEFREMILNKKEVNIAEYKSKKNKTPSRTYKAEIRQVTETLESIDNIVERGYLIYTSLRARVFAAKAAGAAEAASTNIDKPIADIIGKEDYTHLAAVLVREGNYQLLDKYFAEGLPANNIFCYAFLKWQPTLLYYASVCNKENFNEDAVKMLKYLVSKGADPNLTCGDGDTPLFNQCYNDGSSLIMKTLLEIGADPNQPVEIDYDNHKPLNFLLLPPAVDDETGVVTPIRPEAVDRIKLLLDYEADTNYIDEWGNTPLSLAVYNSKGDVREEIVKLLLEKGADVDFTIETMKTNVENYFVISALILSEIYSGNTKNLPVNADLDLSKKYQELAEEIKNRPVVEVNNYDDEDEDDDEDDDDDDDDYKGLKDI